MRGEPGTWAARLLGWISGDAEGARRVVDDLVEEREMHRVVSDGPLRSGLWFWAQVVRAAPHLAARRWERRRRGGGMMEGWMGDVRYGVRQLFRNPVYFGATVLTLALGIGANSALFSVLQQVVLRPLPYEAPEEIYWASTRNDRGDIRDFSFRVAEWKLLRQRQGVFREAGAEFAQSLTVLPPEGEPARIDGRMITGGFFEVFGVTPALGRVFTEEEIEDGEALVTVVSHGFWQRHLGGRPDILGSTVQLNGRSYEVVGVLPASYLHVSDPGVAVYVPYSVGTSRWIGRWLQLYVRTAPGVGPQRARAELDDVMRRVAEADGGPVWSSALVPLRETVLGDVSRMVWILFASVSLLLVIAVANVANLALAQGAARMDEIRVRHALGASRGRLVRQLLVENLLLAGVGGLAGIGLGALGMRLLVGIAPDGIPRLDQVTLDPSVLAFTGLVTLGAGFLFGMVPAVRVSGAGGDGPLVTGVRGTAGRNRGSLVPWLVTAEVALTLTLLVGAGLLVRTVDNLRTRDMGVDGHPALTFRVALPSARYATAGELNGFLDRYLDGLRGLQGVADAGAAANLPLSGAGAVASLRSEPQVRAGLLEPTAALQRRATPGYFRALGVRVVDGRVFDGSEEPDGEQVLVLSESLAEALFPEGGAVGQRVSFRREPTEADWHRVVGVVSDVQYVSADAAMRPQLYQSHLQSPVRDMGIVVRTDGDPMAALAPATALLREMDPTVPIYAQESLAGLMDRSVARRSFALTLSTLFAALAMVLTAAGIYGVLAHAVSRRRTEIGVRMALGAQRPRLARRVTADALGLVLRGVPLGILGAWALGRGMAGLLFGVGGLPVGILVAAALGVTTVAVAAAWIPARRVASVDPCAALRPD